MHSELTAVEISDAGEITNDAESALTPSPPAALQLQSHSLSHCVHRLGSVPWCSRGCWLAGKQITHNEWPLNPRRSRWHQCWPETSLCSRTWLGVEYVRSCVGTPMPWHSQLTLANICHLEGCPGGCGCDAAMQLPSQRLPWWHNDLPVGSMASPLGHSLEPQQISTRCFYVSALSFWWA